jgi:hypothetical protein
LVLSDRQISDHAAEALVWRDWLTLYVESCGRDLDPDELNMLAAAVPAAVADPDLLSRLVDKRTADEARHLIALLAGVADIEQRRLLVASTVRSPSKVGARRTVGMRHWSDQDQARLPEALDGRSAQGLRSGPPTGRRHAERQGRASPVM